MAIPTTAASSLSGVSTGTGSTVDFTVPVSAVSMMLTKTGTVTGGLVAMEVSHDGTNWAVYESVSPSVRDADYLALTSGAFQYFRARILSDVTGGGTVSATFMGAA